MIDAAYALICVDLGTTNTRVWRVSHDGQIQARASAQVGVRDTAREGSGLLLCRTLRRLVDDVASSPTIDQGPPTAIVAAGMITSSLGLKEIPHVAAPAGINELAAGTQSHLFPDITPLPVWLIPGVRSGEAVHAEVSEIEQVDLMRGEETLCIGLLSMGLACGAGTVLNLGSHWKAIRIDAAGRVAGSITSLAGEMIHAAQTTTILSSALPANRPEEYDPKWIIAGMKAERDAGLARANFCVRLLELAGQSTAEQRLAFLVGAFIAADLDALLRGRIITSKSPLLIVGNSALATAWQFALSEAGIKAVALSEEQVERAMLAGICRIFAAAALNHSA